MSKAPWNCDCGRSDPIIFKKRKNERFACNCGWEGKFIYGVSLTLAIFEMKRFFMLLLEIIAEWQVIRFAGGLRPVILTLLDIIVGLPTAMLAVRIIRKYKMPRCSKPKKLFKCLLFVITICVLLNIMTLISIGYHISVKQETLVNIFNASMHLYINMASYKYAIDELQLVFQCCGHTSYTDWFLFDWQMADYASRDEMIYDNRISDEEFRDRGVPFSCCSLRSMTPCVHAEMMDKDIKSINENGCAEVISPVIIRIVVIAYVMTTTLIVTQALLAFLIARVH
ncbi:tetraspanin-6-like [Vespa velutina]|uniref:tetraspanin-6-like n=1 Tax=Vespa velutina TaxID=202808 RepID=UPI001FB3E6F0|nr:tetraspanin-6-like [Vespa velutina]